MTTQIIFRYHPTLILEAKPDENDTLVPDELQGINFLIRDKGETGIAIKSGINSKTIILDQTCNHITGEDLKINEIQEINFIPKSQYTGKEFG